jgi:hypothetical protein
MSAVQEEELSTSRLKIIVIAITILGVIAFGIWGGIEIALRVTSGG